MTFNFDMVPDGDVENDGWTFVSGDASRIWEVFGDFDDDCYVVCPSYRGGVAVKFPFDVDDLPEGAIIDSVTVFIRMKTQSGSGPRAVTVNIRSRHNRGRFGTRTLFATNTFQTYEVGTFRRDPLGRRWTIHTLNHLELRVFSRNNIFDSIRISQLYIRVNFHTKPKVEITSPTGTVFTASPLLTWNYLQDEGEPQEKAEYKIFTSVQVETPTFNPHNATPVFRGTVQGERRDEVLPTSINSGAYYVFLRVFSEFGARSSWVNRKFTVQAPLPAVPGDDNAGIAGTPGVGRPSVVPDSFTSSAVIRMRDASNLLSVQQADFEIASDALEYTATNCTLTRNITQKFPPGVASMEMSASTAATMAAKSTLIEIVELAPMTARAQLKAVGTARTINLKINFYDAGFALLGGAMTASASDSISTWTELVVTNGSSPAGTRYAEVVIEVVSPLSAEKHYVDHVGLMYGTDSGWCDGGHVSRNMLTSHLATGDDPASAINPWVASNVATTVSRVTSTGTGKHGDKMWAMESTAVATSIGHRATGSVFTTPTSGKNYTLNKPAGVQNNDLLLAFVTSNEHGGITPPVGWTLANTASVDDPDGDIALFILKRSGLAADPSSWTDGELTVTSTRRTAVVVAYSGAAHADEQFPNDNIKTSEAGSLVHQTAVANNSDPNAWRIAAFAASDDNSSGTFTANEDPPAGPDDITFVNSASHWKSTTSGASYTINKPPGVKENDLMVATVAFGGEVTSGEVNAPAGWTVKNTKFQSSNTSQGGISMVVMARTAGISEPASWTASHTGSSTNPRISQCVAYRGADVVANQFIDTEIVSNTNSYKLTTGTVTNTNSDAWRVSIWSALTAFGDDFPSQFCTESRERNDNTTNQSNLSDIAISMWDSDGPVSTGNHSRKAETDDTDTNAMIGWIGLVKPAPATAAPGANETERVDNNNGSSDPWISTAVYDSNGVAPVGNNSLYGTFAAGGGGTVVDSMVSWIGIIKPATGVEAGVVQVRATSPVDISNINSEILTLAKRKITMVSSFLGSTAGTPFLKVGFYQANQLITELTAVGESFNTTVWNKTWAEFPIPNGTTRIMPILGAYDRNIGDDVYFDRVAMKLGGLEAGADGHVTEPTWRNGTSRDEHPIWSVPEFYFADDDGSGYGAFIPLRGQKINPPFYGPRSGELTYIDHTIVPLHNRKYRVQTISHGLNGDKFSSGLGPETEEAAFTASNWWIKDMRDLSLNMQLKVLAEPMKVGTTNTAVVFQPLGERYPLVVSEGYKADSVELTLVMKRDEYADLKKILDSKRTLLLQSDVDHSWWVRAVGDLEVETQVTSRRAEDPIRFVKVTFVEVEPEE